MNNEQWLKSESHSDHSSSSLMIINDLDNIGGSHNCTYFGIFPTNGDITAAEFLS